MDQKDTDQKAMMEEAVRRQEKIKFSEPIPISVVKFTKNLVSEGVEVQHGAMNLTTYRELMLLKEAESLQAAKRVYDGMVAPAFDLNFQLIDFLMNKAGIIEVAEDEVRS